MADIAAGNEGRAVTIALDEGIVCTATLAGPTNEPEPGVPPRFAYNVVVTDNRGPMVYAAPWYSERVNVAATDLDQQAERAGWETLSELYQAAVDPDGFWAFELDGLTPARAKVVLYILQCGEQMRDLLEANREIILRAGNA